MTRKRSVIEIYLDVLKAVKSGTRKPTNIMYKCNLAWKPFKQILDSLVENDLLEINQKGKRRTYHLTEKGNEALKYFETARSLLVTLTKSNSEKQTVALA
ncbi:DUF4364 family protein [Candidatus Bathyarchaeota archaeon]|nr:DUF4364 family protein [Candidatus Bathyarchaeota archaeon]